MKDKIEIAEDIKHLFEGCDSIAEIKDRCYRILTDQPDFFKIRVFLSKIYYIQGYFDFAVRELKQVNQNGDYPVINRILKTLGVGVSEPSSKNEILAEIKLN